MFLSLHVRNEDHFKIVDMSALEYQPTSRSLIVLSFLVTDFSVSLMNLSSQERPIGVMSIHTVGTGDVGNQL